MAKTQKHPKTDPAEQPIPRPKLKRESPAAQVLDELKEKLPALKTAAELPPPEQEVIQPEPNRPRGFTEQIMAKRAAMLAVPDGFRNVSRHFDAGIRVNKSLDKSVVAIQFAEDKLPTRAEKDLLEALGQPESEKFTYKPATRQWQREASGEYGANIIEAVRLADGMAKEREGRGR